MAGQYKKPKLVGIVNITEDSFSDGGKFLAPDRMIAHVQKLVRDGADLIELGPESSHPDAQIVSSREQIRRLDMALEYCTSAQILVSIDSSEVQVQKFGMTRNIAYLNDVTGFPPNGDLYARLKDSDCKVIIMHSMLQQRRATRMPTSPGNVIASIFEFFDQRINGLVASGISSNRIILDPGMGFFLGSNPEPSLSVLAYIEDIRRRFGCPIMVSVSRKSFLRNISPDVDGDISTRTLVAEVYACMNGVDYLRTHDVRAAREATIVLDAINACRGLVNIAEFN